MIIKWTLVLSATFSCIDISESYKILVAYPFPAKSHNNLGNGVIAHLLKAGHEVTYITPFPLKNNDPKLRQVDVSDVINSFQADVVNIHSLMHHEVELSDDNSLFSAVIDVVAAVIKNENVEKLLNDPTEKFDVIVNEWMFTEIYSGFAVVFNCPYIWTFPYEPYINVLTLIDEAPNPAYVPNLISNNVPPFNFVQRVAELYSQTKSYILRKYYQLPQENALYEEVFEPILRKRGRTLPSYYELRLNASMILGNSHVSMGQPLRLPENYKSISGYYIDENVKPLPEDLQTLMDNAKEGVIYFSLGSNLKSKDLPESIKKGLVKMFGELKEDVLWKFEEQLPNLPKNVHITAWAPQPSVLAHPSCKVFITHGGLLSTTEAIHFGIPTIGIPVFVDQFNNVDRLVQKGSAKRVDISYSLAEDLREAIKEVTGDHKYMVRAKELSLIYHDRPISPGVELVHWVEHVVRTRGALHLRSSALHVPWYQKVYLDLAAFLFVLLVFTKRILKLLVSICLSKKKNKAQKKNN